MLKFQYTENGPLLDWSSSSIETIVAQRAIVSLRTGCSFHVQPGWRSFPIPIAILTLGDLEVLAGLGQSQQVMVDLANAEIVEIYLSGVWITEQVETRNSIFLMSTTLETEKLIHQFWQRGQQALSARNISKV